MKKLEDLVKEKGGQTIDPKYKDAKMKLLQHLSGMAGDAMGSDLKGLKKVTVASDSPEGLKMGLDKAKDVVAQGGDEDMGDSPDADALPDGDPEAGPAHESETGDEEDSEEAMESPEDEAKEGEADTSILKDEINHETGEGDMSDEEIEELIALLQSKKKGK